MSSLKEVLKNDILDLKVILDNVNKFSKRPKLLRSMLKKVCIVWSQDDDHRMVLALLIIVKTLQRNPDYFSSCSRSMYITYVRNSKFIYGNSIAKNNLMKNGLLEVYSLQLEEAYRHAFIFIRQLAIAVRKAFLHAGKEECRSVYNWQFICSLKFWCEFVAQRSSNDLIKTLIHPLTQVILGAVRLSPGSRWIPLRFHCVECLHVLAGVDKRLRNVETQEGKALTRTVLVPSIPLLLDVFQLVDFNKRASSASKAPMDLRLMLHFSQSQRKETAYLDAVVSWLHDLLTESLCLYSNSVAFPEYAAPAISEIKAFLKSCRVAAFARNFKSLLTKAIEHVDFVKRKRSSIKSLMDSNAIANLESALGQLDSPLLAYYLVHRSVRSHELAVLTERFKYEGEEHMKAGDGFEDETRASAERSKRRRAGGSGSDDDDDDGDESDSNASYDMDDGTTVAHVSRSEKTAKSEDEEDSDDGAFDLDAALNEDSGEEDAVEDDEVKDFRIDDFDDSDSGDEGGSSRRERIMREDPDLGAMADEVDSGEDVTMGSMQSDSDAEPVVTPKSSKLLRLDDGKSNVSKAGKKLKVKAGTGAQLSSNGSGKKRKKAKNIEENATLPKKQRLHRSLNAVRGPHNGQKVDLDSDEDEPGQTHSVPPQTHSVRGGERSLSLKEKKNANKKRHRRRKGTT
uniref:U3 snoRNP protein n=2 Tax=Mesocestoides corti TaxID=53468 RepID=A0A5K3FCE5_MESCO